MSPGPAPKGYGSSKMKLQVQGPNCPAYVLKGIAYAGSCYQALVIVFDNCVYIMLLLRGPGHSRAKETADLEHPQPKCRTP
jgi:hypothetical protein